MSATCAKQAYHYGAGDDDAEDEYANIHDGDDQTVLSDVQPDFRIVVDNGISPWAPLDLGLHQSAEIRRNFVTKSSHLSAATSRAYSGPSRVSTKIRL